MAKKLIAVFRARFGIVAAVVIVLLAALAWHNRFVQDDAFISFRYSQNFVEGHGLVWNVGERVEGYTNFLWVLLVSGALYLGIEPVGFTYVVGIICFILSLIFAFKIAEMLLRSKDWALLAVILLGTNYSFSSYATGGLETQLQTCLFAATIWLLLAGMEAGEWTIRRLTAISVLLSAAILTRPDSVLLAAVVLPTIAFHLWRSRAEKAKKAATLGLPLLIIVGSWLAWKVSYYGDILPNTFYAKVSSVADYKLGLRYLYLFLFSYWLFPFALTVPAAIIRGLRKPNAKALILASMTALWLLYVVKVGGDFMEFRMFVPVMPFIVVLMIWSVLILTRWKLVHVGMVLLLVMGSMAHARHSAEGACSTLGLCHVETIPILSSHLCDPLENWVGIGKALGEAFGDGSDVTVAVVPAGAIPYYSRMKCIDMIGLNDKWIARHGEILPLRMAGHKRRSTFAHLVSRGVSLVIGHPIIVAPLGAEFQGFPPNFDLHFVYGIRASDEVPRGTSLLVIPIDDTSGVLAFYVKRSLAVERAIDENGWQIVPLDAHR